MKTLIALAAASALIASPACAKGKSVSISQHNAVNAAVVGIIGDGSTVSVTQRGIINGAVVAEFWNGARATVAQTGINNASSISQGD